MNEIPELMPGDILLYSGHSIFDLIIRFHTGSFACHAEYYLGGGFSLASRNGKGVAKYPFRLMGLAYVLRPIVKPDTDKLIAWFYARANGKPSGWGCFARFGLPTTPTPRL